MTNEVGVFTETEFDGADDCSTAESKDDAYSTSNRPQSSTRGGIGSRLDEL